MLDKIVCVGDSITKGKVWKDNERRPYITCNSYPSILKDLTGAEVLNDGMCDITSEQLLQRLGQDIMIESKSKVIVEVGGNDCNLNWREIKKDPYGEHEAAIPIEKFCDNVVKIIDMIKGFDAVPVLSTLPPLDGDKYYNLLKRVFGERIKIWIDSHGGIYKWQERYSDAIKDIGYRTGTFVVDIRKSFLDTGNYKKYMSLDGLHPTEDGYILMANTCSRCLGEIL